MFLAKKLFTALLMPLPFSLLLACCGLMLLGFTKRQRLGKLLVLGGIGIIFLASLPPVAEKLLTPLENRYQPHFTVSHEAKKQKPLVHYVVVLGGGHVSDPLLPPTSQLHSSSLARLIEGIRLYRMQPGSKLVFSGGRVFDREAEAVTMQQAALSLGVPPQDILLEADSHDTAEQAVRLTPLLTGRSFLLVTSASHLPRAMALFERQGLHPFAAPANHYIKTRETPAPDRYFPGGSSLRQTEIAIHEYLGLLWTKTTTLTYTRFRWP